MAAKKGKGEGTRAGWHVGQRVGRRDSDELGTVVAVNGKIKVKWDAGRTSYFRHGEDANVKKHRSRRQS